MDKKTVEMIEKLLEKGDRVELIPAKNGIKVIHIKRETIATEDNKKKIE